MIIIALSKTWKNFKQFLLVKKEQRMTENKNLGKVTDL